MSPRDLDSFQNTSEETPPPLIWMDGRKTIAFDAASCCCRCREKRRRRNPETVKEEASATAAANKLFRSFTDLKGQIFYFFRC
jgi:hypothetical protein